MRPARSTLILATAAATLVAAPAWAAAVTVAVDHSVKLPLAGPAGSVVVGNPLVADVTVVDSRSVFVSGRGPGSTDVMVVDPLGRTVFSGDVRVVGEQGSHVVIHRGPSARADLSCDPTCVPSAGAAAGGHNADAGAGAGSGPGSGAPQVVLNAVGGAIAGAATAVAAGAGPRPS